jgi:hypothetical protein
MTRDHVARLRPASAVGSRTGSERPGLNVGAGWRVHPGQTAN